MIQVALIKNPWYVERYTIFLWDTQRTVQQQSTLVEMNHVHFKRGDRFIFKDLSVAIPRGQITAIIGPSGAGKTTLLKLICGQIKPSSGTVLFDQNAIPDLSRKALFALRKRMSILFQNGALFTGISVFDNVAYPIREHTRLPEPLIRTLVLMKLEAVGLRGAADLMPSELSGGMARRVALARAIALDPELIMFDEPFTGQDPIGMGILLELIKKLNDTLKITCVIVSHDIHEVLSIADYAIVVANQHVIAQGSPAMIQASDDPRLHQFLQGEPDGPVSFHFPAAPFVGGI